jgi:methionyl-tRNA synthetase
MREMAVEKDKEVQASSTEKQDWRDDFLKELGENGVIAIESSGVLTKKDIDTAMKAINECESQRDETEEWKLIKEQQRKRAEHFLETNPN